MRILLAFIVLMLIGVIVAAGLTIDFREEQSHQNYLVQCQLSPSQRTLHIVGANDATIDDNGARGTSIKGTSFDYPASAACTQHPITFDQIEEYLPASK